MTRPRSRPRCRAGPPRSGDAAAPPSSQRHVDCQISTEAGRRLHPQPGARPAGPWTAGAVTSEPLIRSTPVGKLRPVRRRGVLRSGPLPGWKAALLQLVADSAAFSSAERERFGRLLESGGGHADQAALRLEDRLDRKAFVKLLGQKLSMPSPPRRRRSLSRPLPHDAQFLAGAILRGREMEKVLWRGGSLTTHRRQPPSTILLDDSSGACAPRRAGLAREAGRRTWLRSERKGLPRKVPKAPIPLGYTTGSSSPVTRLTRSRLVTLGIGWMRRTSTCHFPGLSCASSYSRPCGV
jgi:hypothetical protein